MGIEELECDLLHVLQTDYHNILQRWMSLCCEFRSCVSAKLKQELLYEKDCTNKKSANDRKVSELQKEIDTVKCNIDANILQQKITNKKIFNAVKLQESLKDELEKAKMQKDALSLEMVDLELEMETRKTSKIFQWDAIKRACHIYKLNLDIHINLEEVKDYEEIKFSFFMHSSATKDKYFVRFSCDDNHWKVKQIEPMLKRKHFDQLSVTTDSSNCFKVSDLTLFLCQVRSIFLKYYMKTEKK